METSKEVSQIHSNSCKIVILHKSYLIFPKIITWVILVLPIYFLNCKNLLIFAEKSGFGKEKLTIFGCLFLNLLPSLPMFFIFTFNTSASIPGSIAIGIRLGTKLHGIFSVYFLHFKELVKFIQVLFSSIY